MISPKTLDSDLFKLMFSSVRKISSEFKIQSWKREAEKLKSVDAWKYKTVLGTIYAYENKVDEAIKIFESTLLLRTDPSYHALSYRNLSNVLGHSGKYLESIDYQWKAFDLGKDPASFFQFLNLCSLYYINDPRIYEMTALDANNREAKRVLVEHIEQTIEKISSNQNFNLDLYREILKRSYMTFFKYCTSGIQRLVEINDSEISTILFNSELSLETVELLNDEINAQLVDLLDSYEYEDILKYPIIFTAEKN